jgi:hypothetical protein
MNTSTIAQSSPCRAECDLAVWVGRIGIATFAVTVAALESWLRYPIQPLLDGDFQSSKSRVSRVVASALRHRSL